MKSNPIKLESSDKTQELCKSMETKEYTLYKQCVTEELIEEIREFLELNDYVSTIYHNLRGRMNKL